MKIHYLLATRYDNFGDYVINVELIKLLRSYGEVVVDDAGCDRSFLAELKRDLNGYVAPKRSVKGIRSILECIIRNAAPDCLVLSPGAMAFQPKLKWFLRGVAMYFVLAALKWRGCKIVRLGVSRKPQNNISIDRLLLCLLKQSDVLGFRDSFSLDYFRPYSLPTQQIEYFPDLALFLGVRESEVCQHAKTLVSFSFRRAQVETVGEGFDQASLECAVVGFLDRGFKCQFIYQVEDDLNYGTEVVHALKSHGKQCEERILQVNSLEDAYAAYSAPSVVLTNRLHVAILCLHSGGLAVPLCSSVENIKLYGVFEKIGLAEICCCPSSSSAELLSFVESLLARREVLLLEVKEKLRAAVSCSGDCLDLKRVFKNG